MPSSHLSLCSLQKNTNQSLYWPAGNTSSTLVQEYLFLFLGPIYVCNSPCITFLFLIMQLHACALPKYISSLHDIFLQLYCIFCLYAFSFPCFSFHMFTFYHSFWGQVMYISWHVTLSMVLVLTLIFVDIQLHAWVQI